MALSNTSLAGSEIDNRVTRLENIVANELNIKLLNQLDAMQQEIRELRGRLEEQQNAMQNLNHKQDTLYLNLDARLNKIADPAKTANAEVTDTKDAISSQSTSATELNHAATEVKSEEELFNSANAKVSARQYSEAIIEFKDLLWQHPTGTYAADAYYWLGELYLMQWQQNKSENILLAQAKEAFTTITNKYKGSSKENDALLKLGLIEVDLQQWAAAREILQRVVTKNPKTATARIAENNLRRIQQKQ